MVVKRVASHGGAFPNVLSADGDAGTGKHVETSRLSETYCWWWFCSGWQHVAATNSGVMMVVGVAMTRTTAETVLAKRRVRTDVSKLVCVGSCGFLSCDIATLFFK